MRVEPTRAGNALKPRKQNDSMKTAKQNKNGNGKSAKATKATSKPAAKKSTKKAAPKNKANRISMFDQPITTVIRALAKRGWKGARAIKAMEAAKKAVSPATVRACIQNVRDKVGNVATLTAAQYKSLEKLAPKEA